MSEVYELHHSWNELLFEPGKWGTAWNAFFGYADGENHQSMDLQVKPYEMADVDDLGYPDGLIAQLALDKLDELGLADNTIVVIWGVHGWHLGDHLVWGKHSLFERALKSALVINGPGTTKGEIVNKVVSS